MIIGDLFAGVGGMSEGLEWQGLMLLLLLSMIKI